MLQKLWDTRMKSHHQATAPLRRMPVRHSTLDEYISRGGLSDRGSGRRCIYIHVPFCSRICSFCNMQRTNCVPPADYAELVARQIVQLSEIPYVQSGEYESVYFGGGTPTTLPAEQLRQILRALRDHLALSPGAEISVESSLSDLDDEKLRALREEGVNRLSIGVQTFSDRGRGILGRRGTGERAARRLGEILASGLSNVNIDLIYNYPGQTPEELERDVAHVRALDIAGLSCYSLVIGDGSLLAKRFNLTEDGYARDTLEKDHACWSRVYGALRGAGFETLELTKLVRPGRDEYRYIRIRHETGDTLPIGAGAGGRIGSLITHAPGDVKSYKAFLEQPASRYPGRVAGEAYDRIYRQIGKLQLGRLDFEGMPAEAEFAFAEMKKFVLENGLGEERGERIILNADGLFWGNNLAHRYATALVDHAGEIWRETK